MNCEEYRKAIAAEPSFDGGAAHLSECAGCQAYRKEMQELDRAIGRALSLDVPELVLPELPDIDNVTTLPKRRRPALTFLALAATVVLAAFVGFRMIDTGGEYGSLGEELLAHIDHERGALVVTDVPVSDDLLAQVVPTSIARLDQNTGLFTYARTCPVNGKTVPHLVMQGERGPVTIILMPDEKISGPETVEGESVRGVILPVGDGSIAIFGEREEALDNIERKILDSVSWST
jgi:hypothetical protein